MYKSTKDLLRERLAHSLQRINKDKKPYFVRGKPSTILYLTQNQAGSRKDLIPGFIEGPKE